MMMKNSKMIRDGTIKRVHDSGVDPIINVGALN